jgi:DeoR family transcriptional regulator, fructose operon transcriptional repressor
MLPTQRRQAILAEVSQRSAVAADDLAREFDVSVETIRRDLRDLERRGLLDRVYGGATRPAGRSSEGSFAARSTRHIQAKRAIAGLAAALVEPGETIVIDVGTTALEVARALPAAFRGRVLTNSVPAALELSAREHIEVLLCGGQVRGGDAACSGATAEAFFAEFYADRAFLGSGGVHPEAGLTDYYPAEVVVRRTIIAHTAACYVLADSSKLGAIAVHRVCPLDRVTAVLTDDAGPAESYQALAQAGVTILQAEGSDGDVHAHSA